MGLLRFTGESDESGKDVGLQPASNMVVSAGRMGNLVLFGC